MCGRFYLDTMHADGANLIVRYLSIRWSDSKTKNTVARISRPFLCYAMNELMHTMQEQIDACNARTKWCMWCKNDFFFFLVHGWSLQTYSLIKSWVQNWESTIRKGLKRQSNKYIHLSKFLKPHTLNPNLSKSCHIIEAFVLLFQE